MSRTKLPARLAGAAAIVVLSGSAGLSGGQTQVYGHNPNDAVAPKTDAECEALNQDWQARLREFQRAHGACINRNGGGSYCLNNFATEVQCLKEFSAPCDAISRDWQEANKAYPISVKRCRDDVSAVKKREAEAEAEKRKEEAERAARNRNSSDSGSSSSSSGSSTRDRETERREAQAKRDERAIERATKASERMFAELASRNREREQERQQIEREQQAANDRYQSDARSLSERAADAIAGLRESFSSTTTPSIDGISSNAAGGSSLFDFDLSVLKPTVTGTGFMALDLAAAMGAPFAGLPFSFAHDLLKSSLQTFNELSNVIANFDKATVADVDKIWNDYQTRVWSPEAFLGRVTMHVVTGSLAHVATENIVRPRVEAVVQSASDRVERTLVTLNPRELLRPPVKLPPIVFPSQGPPPWWVGRAVERDAGYLRRDTTGLPIVRDWNGEVYGYNSVTGRVSYSQTDLDRMIASGDYSLVRAKRTDWTWTPSNVRFLPSQEELDSHGDRVFFPTIPDAPEERVSELRSRIVYTPIEWAIGIGLGKMIESRSEKLSGVAQELFRQMDADQSSGTRQ